MSNLHALLTQIDELSSEELETIYQHVVQRRHAAYWLVPGENLKAIQEIMQPVYEQTVHLNDEEIDAVIDEALDEVRRERKARRSN